MDESGNRRSLIIDVKLSIKFVWFDEAVCTWYAGRYSAYYAGSRRKIRIGRGNRNTQIKPAPTPIYPPQIPHDLT
jgi:hypothetical protein